MRLTHLLVPEIVRPPAGLVDVDVTAITADSRAVAPGALFAALPGSRSDGAQFVPQAVAKGASAILASDGVDLGDVSVPILRASDVRRALALMAARLYSGQPETAVAVTGTSGKTSVVEFTRQIYAAAGRRAASVGTIGVVKPDGGVYGSLTTPDPVSLHRMLSELAAEGVTHLAFEASSHGLDQRRLDGVRLSAGAFLNLGRDHLDYHPTVEDYLAAKIRLFDTLLDTGKPAVINSDDPFSVKVIAAAQKRGHKVLTVGRTGTALRLEALAPDGFGQRLQVSDGASRYDVRLPLLGAYQASNALVAAGLAISTGEAAGPVFAALEHLKGVSGRLDVVGEANGGLVIVDYAHKPDALEAALKALRPFAKRHLVCVFGCGGDRDRGKRPIMGRIAVDLADRVIVTDDNPRSEQPEAIRAEILADAPGATEIGDRAAAIEAAIAGMQEGDVVLIAGKGHETGQIVGNTVIPFSDHDAARAALANLTPNRQSR